MLVSNIRIFGIFESMVASGYPMMSEPPNEKEFVDLCKDVCVNENSIGRKRSEKLANTPIGSGHSNYLNGVIVQFDLNFTVKAWTEAERYHFFDFVSSQSSMHRLTKMNFDNVFYSYVTENTKNEMKRLQEIYNENPTIENKLTLLYNCPTGLQLTARTTTNYRQLQQYINKDVIIRYQSGENSVRG